MWSALERFSLEIDKQGMIQHMRISEGRYGQTEQWLQSLLAEG